MKNSSALDARFKPPPSYFTAGSPPFRSTGRGSKQLVAALKPSIVSPENIIQHKYCFYTGMYPPCFVKVLKDNQFSGTLVQPLRLNPNDPNFLVPWESHILANASKLIPIEVRKRNLNIIFEIFSLF
jgi:hypothetical protein